MRDTQKDLIPVSFKITFVCQPKQKCVNPVGCKDDFFRFQLQSDQGKAIFKNFDHLF